MTKPIKYLLFVASVLPVSALGSGQLWAQLPEVHGVPLGNTKQEIFKTIEAHPEWKTYSVRTLVEACRAVGIPSLKDRDILSSFVLLDSLPLNDRKGRGLIVFDTSDHVHALIWRSQLPANDSVFGVEEWNRISESITEATSLESDAMGGTDIVGRKWDIAKPAGIELYFEKSTSSLIYMALPKK